MLAAGGAGAWGAAACVPLDNLDDYSPTIVEAGGGGSPPAPTPSAGGVGGAASSTPPSNDPSQPGVGGSGGSGGAAGSGGSNGSAGSNASGGSSGLGSGGGSSLPPPTSDAGTTPDPETPDPASLCADGELEGPDDDCFFLDARSQSFFAARSACQARGAGWDLASVRSAEASALLGDALTFEGWLVASDVASEGNWAWLDDGTPFWQGGSVGTPVGGAYANWNVTEPNGGGTTNCMRALPRSAGSANPDAPWADLGCTALRGGICRGPQP